MVSTNRKMFFFKKLFPPNFNNDFKQQKLKALNKSILFTLDRK